MSNCFCHLNGYEVKDKEARTAISNLNTSVSTAQSTANAAKSAAATNASNITALGERVTALEGSGGSGGSATIKHVVYSIVGGATASTNTNNQAIISLYMTEEPPTTYEALKTYLLNKYELYGMLACTGYIKQSSGNDPVYAAMVATNGVLSLSSVNGYSAGLTNIYNFGYQVKEV